MDKEESIDPKPYFILPHTFFHHTFRRIKQSGGYLAELETLKYYRFVALAIIEMQSSLPQNSYVAGTSQIAMKSFLDKIGSEGFEFSLGAKEIMDYFLKSVVYIEEEESLNKLEIEESVIALADKMHSTSVQPIIIVNTDAKVNFLSNAGKFYKLDTKKGITEDQIPFAIRDIREAKGYIEGNYAELSKTVKARTNPIFKI